jgi:hypothetical protein
VTGAARYRLICGQWGSAILLEDNEWLFDE